MYSDTANRPVIFKILPSTLTTQIVKSRRKLKRTSIVMKGKKIQLDASAQIKIKEHLITTMNEVNWHTSGKHPCLLKTHLPSQ